MKINVKRKFYHVENDNEDLKSLVGKLVISKENDSSILIGILNFKNNSFNINGLPFDKCRPLSLEEIHEITSYPEDINGADIISLSSLPNEIGNEDFDKSFADEKYFAVKNNERIELLENDSEEDDSIADYVLVLYTSGNLYIVDGGSSASDWNNTIEVENLTVNLL